MFTVGDLLISCLRGTESTDRSPVWEVMYVYEDGAMDVKVVGAMYNNELDTFVATARIYPRLHLPYGYEWRRFDKPKKVKKSITRYPEWL